MRRLVLEMAEEDIDMLEEGSPLHQIRSYRILHLLRFDREEIAAIVKIRLKDPAAKVEEVLSCDLKMGQLKLLEEDGEEGPTYCLSGRPSKGAEEVSFGLYPAAPFEIKDGKIAFLGETRQLKALLEKVDDMKVPYKVASLTDARFSGSPLDGLTEKQRKVLVAAFEEGYHETPRRTGSAELARKLGLKSPTLVEHRRKAEQRVLSALLKG